MSDRFQHLKLAKKPLLTGAAFFSHIRSNRQNFMTKETKVRVHEQQSSPAAVETPSETMVRAAVKTGEITDARGRRISVRRLSALDRMRLYAAAGPELSNNIQWIGVAAVAASCAAIDGDPVPKPASRMQVEALVERLDDDGLEAIAEVYKKTFGVGAEEDIAAKAETAKN